MASHARVRIRIRNSHPVPGTDVNKLPHATNSKNPANGLRTGSAGGSRPGRAIGANRGARRGTSTKPMPSRCRTSVLRRRSFILVAGRSCQAAVVGRQRSSSHVARRTRITPHSPSPAQSGKGLPLLLVPVCINVLCVLFKKQLNLLL